MENKITKPKNDEMWPRIWDGEKIIYLDNPRQISHDDGGHQYLAFYSQTRLRENNNGREFIIQRYSGVNDIDNRHIYEGDIIKLERDEGNFIEIGFSDGYFVTKSVGNNCLIWLSKYNAPCKVVGNIFQNKELLKINE